MQDYSKPSVISKGLVFIASSTAQHSENGRVGHTVVTSGKGNGMTRKLGGNYKEI